MPTVTTFTQISDGKTNVIASHSLRTMFRNSLHFSGLVVVRTSIPTMTNELFELKAFVARRGEH